MVKSEEEGSADPYKITLSHFGDTVKNNLSRRKPVQDVIDLYDKIRGGGNMNEEVQEQFFNDISETKWATSLKTAGSTHGSYKALKGNGGRHENRRFSNWVIVSACWPDAEKLPEIRANMATYWGLATFPDGEFPKVAADKQMTLYLGKLEKKHTSKSKAKSKGKAPQKLDQGGDDGSSDSDSSDCESDDEVIIDEESTKAAQEARDKSLQEEVQKEKNSDSNQVDKASNSSGLTTMEKIEKARANVSKAYANRGAKRPADPTPATDSPPAKRASTHSALDLQAIALADLLRDLSSNSERLQKLEEETRQTREENHQLREENRQLKERVDKVEAAHYGLDKRHADFEKETMDTLVVLLDVAQAKSTSEATEATWTAASKVLK